MKSVGAGIALGIPNFFSIYFLLKTFQFWDKSIAIPLNNVSIVIVSALLGYFLFKEKLSNINALGVLIAIVSILLISGIVF
jgi:drug/metabolite transporter (DMT)-like permease